MNTDVSALLFFFKLKIVEKQLRKLNCSYGKESHALKEFKSNQFHSIFNRRAGQLSQTSV